MSNPRFSFLIPVYNQVGKMDRCIESVKAQTFTDFEVILVNDGSTDGSQEMLDKFAEEDARFKVFSHEKNRSLLCARFTGMKNASGDYVVYLDSDDYVDAELLAELDELIKTEKPDVIRYGRTIEPMGYQLPVKKFDDPLKSFMTGENDPRIVETCISTELTKKVVELVPDPPYVNNAEDTFMSATIYTFAKKFSYLDKPYYHYEIYGGMSRNSESLSMEKLQRVKQSLDNCSNGIIEYFKKYNPDKVDLCYTAAANFYKYETMHFVLNTDDECKAVEFINGFADDRFPDVFEYACKEILPEFFKRKLVEGHKPDKYKFYLF